MGFKRYDAATHAMIRTAVLHAEALGTKLDYARLAEKIRTERNRHISVAALRVKVCHMRQGRLEAQTERMEARVQRVRTMLGNGSSLTEAARKVGVSKSALSRLLERYPASPVSQQNASK